MVDRSELKELRSKLDGEARSGEAPKERRVDALAGHLSRSLRGEERGSDSARYPRYSENDR